MGEWILTSSILIIMVIAARRLLKGRIRLWLQYGLWLLVLVRLLLPFSIFDSRLSVLNAAGQAKEQAAESAVGQLIDSVGEMSIPVESYDTAYRKVVESYEEQGFDISSLTSGQKEELEYEAYNRMVSGVSLKTAVIMALYGIWIAGMIVVGGSLVIANVRFAGRLKGSRKELETDSVTLVPVYESGLVETPCLFGVIHPAVYLTPEAAENKTVLGHVLEHEQTHYRHGDHVWAFLRCVCLMIHWYNPLVWKAAELSRQDSELGCDEATIRIIGEESRVDYGRTILELSCQKPGRRDLLTAATTMVGGKESLKERITLIAKKPKTAVWAGIGAVAVVILAVGCTFTGRTGNEQKPSEEKTVTVNTEADEQTAGLQTGKENSVTKADEAVSSGGSLWPEDKRFACAKFEYAGELAGGYKVVTSEISQFISLNQMRLIPDKEKSLDTGWIYRLTFDWNGVVINGEEYIVEVGQDCLSVNGQVYVADGFDFSKVIDYFTGKYVYLDYELQYESEWAGALCDVYDTDDGMKMTAYLEGGEPYKTYIIADSDWAEKIHRGMTKFHWTETENQEISGERVILESADGSSIMIFSLEGEKDVVSYSNGEETVCWKVKAGDDIWELFVDSLGAWVRRVYDDIDCAAHHVSFTCEGADEEIAGEFMENVLRNYYLDRIPGGWVTAIDYEALEWSILDVSENGGQILGQMKFAVKPEDPAPRTASFWSGGTVNGEAEYEGWVIYSTQFLLEQQENGEWIWDTGYFGQTLEEIQ